MNKKGFSLIELMVALALFSLLSSGLFIAFKSQLKSWQKLSAKAEKMQLKSSLLVRISRESKGANKILAVSNTNKLALQLGGNTVEYGLNKSKVRRKKNKASSYLTCEDEIKQLAFAYPQANLVTIKLAGLKSTVLVRNQK